MKKIAVRLVSVLSGTKPVEHMDARIEEARALIAAVHLFGHGSSRRSFTVSDTGRFDSTMNFVDADVEEYVCEVDEPSNRAALETLWLGIQEGTLSPHKQGFLSLKIKDVESRRISEVIKFSRLLGMRIEVAAGVKF